MSFSCKYIIFFPIVIICSCNNQTQVKFSVLSPDNNLAYNGGNALFPNPLESDKGWGGAPFKWHLVDGIRSKANYWNYGLAFTGGILEYIDTCGWRQATINFGKPVKFNRIVVWLNKSEIRLMPDSFKILCWNDHEQNWSLIKEIRNKLKQVELYYSILCNDCAKNSVDLVIPYEEAFPDVQSSKVRFLFNNCGIDHGWINEFEVYLDTISEQNNNLIIKY